MKEEEIGSLPSTVASNDSINSNNNNNNNSVGYSKTKLLGLFSLFDIDRYDIAVVLAAIEKVDTKYSQTIDVHVFVQSYVKEWGYVLLFLWEKYFELYHGLKEPLVSDNDKIQENDDENDTMEDDKDKDKDTADIERRKQLLEERERPEYFLFLSFLFFIMSITDREEMSRFVYWMYYANHRCTKRKGDNNKDHSTNQTSSSSTATLDTLMDIIPLLWGNKPAHKKLVPKLMMKVLKSTRHLDMDEFDATKFHILDFSTKGSWTTPIRKMQSEVKWRFASSVVWHRVIERVHSTLRADIDVALDRLDCPRRKKGAKVYTDKGERKLVRQYVRKYLRLLKGYLDVPRGEDLNGSGNGNMKMMMMSMSMKTIAAYVGRLGSKVMMRLGLSKEQIHPSSSSSSSSSSVENNTNDSNDNSNKKGGGSNDKENNDPKTKKKKGDDDDDDEVPLEKRYRAALIVNVDVLNGKAVTAKERALQRIDQANDCVYDDFDFDISLLTKK